MQIFSVMDVMNRNTQFFPQSTYRKEIAMKILQGKNNQTSQKISTTEKLLKVSHSLQYSFYSENNTEMGISNNVHRQNKKP